MAPSLSSKYHPAEAGLKAWQAGSKTLGHAGVEVEVKLRLPDSTAHERVRELLARVGRHKATRVHSNFYFDGAEKELSKERVSLRIRFYDTDVKCVVIVKGKAVLVNGICTSSLERTKIDPKQGRAYVAQPSLLSTSEVPLIASVRQRHQCSSFVCLGGFQNIRTVFTWHGHSVEVDETKFPFGTQYEIECESSTPEMIKAELELLLRSNDIPFGDSKSSKFTAFTAGHFLE